MSLRPIAEGDLGRLGAWRNDHRVHPFFFFDGLIDPARQGEWLDSVRRDDTRRFFAIEADGDFAGTISLDRIDARNRSGELGNMLVDPGRQAKGFGREAVGQLLALAFGALGLERVELRVFADNEVAIRLYETCRFRREGVERGAVLRDGRRRDVLRMALLAGDR